MAKPLTKDDKVRLLEGKYNAEDAIVGITGLRGDQDSDRQMRSQTKRNKANFMRYKQHFKKSQLAKNFDAGRLNSKDLGEINKIFSESAKNKATMIKKLKRKK